MRSREQTIQKGLNNCTPWWIVKAWSEEVGIGKAWYFSSGVPSGVLSPWLTTTIKQPWVKGDHCEWSVELNNAVYLGSSWHKFYIDLKRIYKWAQSNYYYYFLMGRMIKCCLSRIKGRQSSPPTKAPDEGIRKATLTQHSMPFNWWGRLLLGLLKSLPSFKSASLSCVSSIFYIRIPMLRGISTSVKLHCHYLAKPGLKPELSGSQQ